MAKTKFNVNAYLDEEQGLPDVADSVQYATQAAANEYLSPSPQVEAAQSARSVLSEAVQRMEQANLYKTILDNTIFQEGSARPEILDMVEGEFKAFAEDRLSTLLGMKTASKPTPTQFSEPQAEILKSFANKILDKASPAAEVAYVPPKPVVTKITAGPKQVLAAPQAAPSKPAVRPTPVPAQAAPEAPRKPTPARRGRPPGALAMPQGTAAEEMKYARETASLGSGIGETLSGAITGRSSQNSADYSE